MSEFKNILTDRLKADWQGNMALFYFLIPCLPACPAGREKWNIFNLSRQRFSVIFLSDLRSQGRIILSGRAGGGISKSFWSLFYWWDLVGNNTETMPQTSSAIFSILMKQKRNILGQTSRTASHRTPELIRDLMDALVPSILVQKIFSSHF